MRRDLGDGFELDDDRARVDVEAAHAYLSGESYWAQGRPIETMVDLVAGAQRVVGLYRGGRMVGFCRALSDEYTIAYLADVYVLDECRGRGLGVELVREMVERGPYAHLRWFLATRDAHGLYQRFGFATPSDRVMERPRP